MSSRDTSWSNVQQVGEGSWTYNNTDYTFDQLLAPVEGLQVNYNGLGSSTVWINEDLL